MKIQLIIETKRKITADEKHQELLEPFTSLVAKALFSHAMELLEAGIPKYDGIERVGNREVGAHETSWGTVYWKVLDQGGD